MSINLSYILWSAPSVKRRNQASQILLLGFPDVQGMEKPREQVILIVDDDPDLLELFTGVVECAGFKVLSASNGLEALELVESHKVNLVFSDVDMPRCDGFQLLKRIKAKDSHDPIVLLQTADITIDLEQVFLLGAEGIYFKPFDLDNLLTAIHSYFPPTGRRWRRFSRHAVDLHAEIHSEQQSSEWRHCSTLARGGMFVEGVPHTNVCTILK